MVADLDALLTVDGLDLIVLATPSYLVFPATIVIATIQGNVPGTWVLGAYVNSTSKFTIRLNRAAPAQLVVGWFIVN